jgi:hypothetical protein
VAPPGVDACAVGTGADINDVLLFLVGFEEATSWFGQIGRMSERSPRYTRCVNIMLPGAVAGSSSRPRPPAPIEGRRQIEEGRDVDPVGERLAARALEELGRTDHRC